MKQILESFNHVLELEDQEEKELDQYLQAKHLLPNQAAEGLAERRQPKMIVDDYVDKMANKK